MCASVLSPLFSDAFFPLFSRAFFFLLQPLLTLSRSQGHVSLVLHPLKPDVSLTVWIRSARHALRDNSSRHVSHTLCIASGCLSMETIAGAHRVCTACFDACSTTTSREQMHRESKAVAANDTRMHCGGESDALPHSLTHTQTHTLPLSLSLEQNATP